MTHPIIELAEHRARLQQHLTNLGMMSLQSDPAKRVVQDAQYELVKSAAAKADKDYRDAISALSAEELEALSNDAAGDRK